MSVSEATASVSRARAGQARLEAVRGLMRERGVEVLLAFGSGRHHFIATNLCWWLSGLRHLGRDAVVAVPLEGEPQLLVTPSWDEERAARQSWIEEVSAVDDLAGALPDLLRSRGWQRSSLGLAGTGDSSQEIETACRELLADATDLTAALVTLGGRQDEYALSCVRRAVEIAEAGWRRLVELARPGLAEYRLAAEVDIEMRAHGADDNFLLMSASQHNRAVHAPTSRELASGDIILGEISPSVDGQFAQICRSVVIGRATASQREGFGLLGEALTIGLDACRPGVPVPEVAAKINAFVASHGYEQYTKPPYMRSRGHAMGLGPMVPTDVSDRSEVTLESGMTFVLHPNQYLPESGYLLCGDQVVITDEGVQALSHPQLELLETEEAAA